MFESMNLECSMYELGASYPAELFVTLDRHYSEESRFYHDKSHVAECLRQFEPYRSKAEFPAEIEIAIWFHDVIYDTRAGDNEEQSAAFAERVLVDASAEAASIRRIVDMILATKTHQVDA